MDVSKCIIYGKIEKTEEQRKEKQSGRTVRNDQSSFFLSLFLSL